MRYPQPVHPVAVRLFESFRPGALVRVIAIDSEGREKVAWEGADPGRGESAVVLLPLRSEGSVARLRLVFDTKAIPGWNEIDAVGLHDMQGRLWWAESASASSSAAEGAAAPPAKTLPPLLELEPSWRTSADGLLPLLIRMRNQEVDQRLEDELVSQVVAVQRVPTPDATFAGRWESNYGPMRLEVEGSEVRGSYPGGHLVGTLEGRRLTFRFQEPEGQGQGWFELLPSGEAFRGRYGYEGSSHTRRWRGHRSPGPTPGLTWLVVLEAPWEEGLAEKPYAFGEMLETFFAATPGVAVRRRTFTDGESLEGWARQLAWLEGPVVLVISTHSTREGLESRDELIPPARVARALAGAHDLRLVHFSSCETMAGEMPSAVLDACRDQPAFAGVSGYDVSVDWMGSALSEFLYLDLILERGLEPSVAAKELQRLLAFTGDQAPVGSPIPALHFRFAPAH